MGLDQYLHRRTKNEKEKILAELSGEELPYEEVMYWRKEYQIDDWFRDLVGGVGNCEDTRPITKEELEELISFIGVIRDEDDEWKQHYDDMIEQLKDVIEETDWDNEEIVYYIWF